MFIIYKGEYGNIEYYDKYFCKYIVNLYGDN